MIFSSVQFVPPLVFNCFHTQKRLEVYLSKRFCVDVYLIHLFNRSSGEVVSLLALDPRISFLKEK